MVLEVRVPFEGLCCPLMWCFVCFLPAVVVRMYRMPDAHGCSYLGECLGKLRTGGLAFVYKYVRMEVLYERLVCMRACDVVTCLVADIDQT